MHVVFERGVHVFVAEDLLHDRDAGNGPGQPARKSVAQGVGVDIKLPFERPYRLDNFGGQLAHVVPNAFLVEEQRAPNRISASSKRQPDG